MTKQIKVIISGRVVGVSYRAWTKTQARSLGLTGWVKNVDDQVEAIFQGDEEKVNKMINLLKLGPPASYVKDIKVFSEKNKEIFSKFEIKKY